MMADVDSEPISPPTDYERSLATRAQAAIAAWEAKHRTYPDALVFHPRDLTERMDTEGARLWGMEIRHSEDVERGTVEIIGPLYLTDGWTDLTG